MTEQEIKSYLPERLRIYPLPEDFPYHYSEQEQILVAYNAAAQIERTELMLKLQKERNWYRKTRNGDRIGTGKQEMMRHSQQDLV